MTNEKYSPTKMYELKTYLQHAADRGRLGEVGPNKSYGALLGAAQSQLLALRQRYAEGVTDGLPEYKDWKAIVDIAKTYGEDVSYSSSYEKVSSVLTKITSAITPDKLSASISAEIDRTKRVQFEDCGE